MRLTTYKREYIKGKYYCMTISQIFETCKYILPVMTMFNMLTMSHCELYECSIRDATCRKTKLLDILNNINDLDSNRLKPKIVRYHPP